MTSVSISQLKANPSKVIGEAVEYPVSVKKRNRVQAYLVGKDLYEKMIAYIEEYVDLKAVSEADYKKGKDFETVAEELSI